jgi:hypothetical protein
MTLEKEILDKPFKKSFTKNENHWTEKDWKAFVKWMDKHSATLTSVNMKNIELGIRQDERNKIIEIIDKRIEELEINKKKLETELNKGDSKTDEWTVFCLRHIPYIEVRSKIEELKSLLGV